MRHANKNRTLSRSRSQRTALLRNLAIDLITKEKLSTTTAKAKEVQPLVEKLITHSKVDTVAKRRLVNSALGEPAQEVTKKLFGEIAKKYQDRKGGYTRIIKMGRTLAGRDKAIIELV